MTSNRKDVGLRRVAFRCLFSTAAFIAALLVFYILFFPLAIKLNNNQIPGLYGPLVSVLESPWRAPLIWYLELWGIPIEYGDGLKSSGTAEKSN